MAVATPALSALLLAVCVLLPSATPTPVSSSSAAAATAGPAPAAAPKEADAPKEVDGLVSPTNGTGSYKGMPREFVNGHNKLRARYGVPPVRWDNKLARQARRWSNAMRDNCELRHSGSRFGESIFVGRDGWNATAADALAMWGAEEPLYDKQTGRCTGGRHFRECGHFALMVNPKYLRIGCARAECFKGGVFITCNYYFLNH